MLRALVRNGRWLNWLNYQHFSTMSGDTSSESDPVAILIMAAGKGTRMNDERPKVVIPVGGVPMIQRILRTASELAPKHTVVITGHCREQVESCVAAGSAAGLYPPNGITYAVQEQLLGTGDAVRSGMQALNEFVGTVLILSGDVPLIETSTIANLLATHHESKATVSFVTCSLTQPKRYGRVVRNAETGLVQKIVEAKDCTAQQLLVSEINAGIYAIDSAFLAPALEKLDDGNAQGEFYLTDLIEDAVSQGQGVSTLLLEDPTELLGVNSRSDLCLVNQAVQRQKVMQLIESGVIVKDPESLYVEEDVKVEAGVVLGPNVQLLGETHIKRGTSIEGTALIVNSTVGPDAELRLGVRVEESQIGAKTLVGPFAHLRPDTILEDHVKLGNFVETKRATLRKGAKASHLSYIGDAEVGADANIGAGTITCNYDGFQKHHTSIGAGAFIGSNTSLIAPVSIGAGAITGAGSAISKDVPQDALAVTRAPQAQRDGWAAKKRKAEE